MEAKRHPVLSRVAVVGRRMFHDDVPSGCRLLSLLPWAQALILIAGVGAARANDSTAKLDVGGLSPLQNDSIEIQEADLYLNQKEVCVRCKFFNSSSSGIETLVAFPLREIERNDYINKQICWVVGSSKLYRL